MNRRASGFEFRWTLFCFNSALVLLNLYIFIEVSTRGRPHTGGGLFAPLKAKFRYAILVADRFEACCRPAVSWNLAYHLAR